ncbi:Uncharacterised protein [Enterobacter cloacae]|nr:Uncharacterised protein [Enterobacter cloacae]CZW51264.1 Uncharacterised protein [Enterobacter cloacae]SSH75458.1 Uncharacterised protein [Klebsiella pneumoniae]
MIAFTQRFLWFQRPVAFIVNNGCAKHLVTIINGHGVARFAFTAEYRTGFIRDVTAFQLARNRPGIILGIGHIRFGWRRGIHNNLNRIGRIAFIAERIFLNDHDIMFTLGKFILRCK